MWDGRAVVALLALTAVLSGCTTPSADPKAAVTQEARPSLPPGRGALEVYVADTGFRSLAGATVEVESSSEVRVTDAKGRVVLGPLSPGPLRLTASYEGHVPHTRRALVVEGEVELIVFLLAPIPKPVGFTVTQVQKGLMACTVALDPPGAQAPTLGRPGVLAAQSLECGAPVLGGPLSAQRETQTAAFDPVDRSLQRWNLDEPDVAWVSAVLTARWTAQQELAREIQVVWSVDGCTGASARFAAGAGSSPLVLATDAARVRHVLQSVHGTTCRDPAERCDKEACTIATDARAFAQRVADPSMGVGAALQQVYEETLVARFAPDSLAAVQTLK